MTTENLVSVSDIDRENFTNGVGTDDYPQITTSAKPETNGTDFYIRFRIEISTHFSCAHLYTIFNCFALIARLIILLEVCMGFSY